MIRFSGFYRNGAKAGLSPRQIDELSLWEFHCVMDGLEEFHGGGARRGPEITDEDYDIWREMGVELDG